MISKSHILLIMCDIYTSKGIITRPNAFFLREYDPIEKSFSKTIIIDVKHRKLPTKLIQKLEDISILKICWDEEKTSLILETLIHEAGFVIKVLPILDLKNGCVIMPTLTAPLMQLPRIYISVNAAKLIQKT